MTQRDNILQELNELGSQLSNSIPQNTYSVPAGYFEGLVTQVLNRIRAMEAANAAEELSYLSPLLSSISRQMPYTVPAGYFESLNANIKYAVTSTGKTAQQETESIAPLLAGLKKENPYSVPPGYFENLAGNIAAKESRTEAKVISITRRSWLRYAAAAVVAGIIFMTGFLLSKGSGEPETGGRALANVSKDVKKLNDTQKAELIDFLDINGTETAQISTDNKSKEIQQLLSEISDEELRDFQEQSEDVEDVLITN
ncbi:MAG: hypothetical protein FJY20_02865 [Bacteroidetes bacterium]|nr:hypothetical protein [Bacteroidota bacterium]